MAVIRHNPGPLDAATLNALHNNFQRDLSMVPPPAPQRGHGGSLTSVISELGGAGGMVGGAAAGAAAGSVVPGIGNVIGGLIGGAVGGFGGGTAGRLAENKIRDNRYNAGSALKEGGWDAVFGAGPLKLAKGAYAGAGALKAGAPLLPNIERGVTTSLLNKAGSDTAARTFARAFTIQSKLAPQLKPVETSQQLLKYGVKGSLNKMADTAARVTGENGALSRVARQAVDKIPGDIKVDEFYPTIRDSLTRGAMIDQPTEKKILASIFKMDKPGILPGTMNPTEAFDLAKNLEKTGYQFINSSTKLSPNVKNEQIGKVYVDASKAITDRLEHAANKFKTVEGLKTPETIAQLNKVSPRLASEFKNVKSWSDLRSLQAPFVRLNHMVGLTNDAAQSVGGTLGSGLGARAGGAGVGFMAGGPAGAAAGFMAGPVIEGAEQAARAPLTTRYAGAISKLAGQGGSTIPTIKGALARSTAGSLAANGPPKFTPPAPQQSQQQGPNDLQLGSQLDGLGGQVDPTTGQPSGQAGMQAQAPQSPYSLERALSDVQRDPKHASEYLSIYNTVDQTMRANQKQQKAASPYGKPTAQQYALATRGYGSLQNLMRMIQQDPSQVQKTNLPGQGLKVVGGLAQSAWGTSKYHATANDIATTLLYLSTGAQANASEIQNFQKNYLPQTGDSPASINNKLQILSQAFSPFLSGAGSSGPSQDDLTSALSQLQGGGYGY